MIDWTDVALHIRLLRLKMGQSGVWVGKSGLGEVYLFDFQDEDLNSTTAAPAEKKESESKKGGGGGGLPNIKQTARVSSGWATAPRVLAPIRRRTVQQQIPPAAARPNSALNNSSKTSISKVSSVTSAIVNTVSTAAANLGNNAAIALALGKNPKIDDEYDPNKPNEYEVCKTEAKRRRREAKYAKKKSLQQELDNKLPASQHGSSDSLISTNHYNVDTNQSAKNAFESQASISNPTDPPKKPVILAPSDPQRAVDDNSDDDDVDGVPLDTSLLQHRSLQLPPAAVHHMQLDSGEDAYLRRMGMSSIASAVVADSSGDEAYLRRKKLGQHSTESCVILLQNMVGPGEVDEDLEEETASECAKFGKVDSVRIYEVRDVSVSSDEAVRIFVKFQSIESAREAKSKMDGRFFGRRTIKATYFDENRFISGHLAP
ncbi:hypothetical protein HK100_004742 [Physocladia obscura]|uniref:RRM domain-containing protein n=1 Tax=Physocladia obscura TaxID=109957 RepID=A0AAD5SU05_9FUNG|nr:hypothetical protein HK100_004742 [Physocladia obscura]